MPSPAPSVVPLTAQNLSPQIRAIARASQRMNRDDACIWHSRLELVYGEMEGQREVDFSSFAGNLDRRSTTIALESLYYLATVLLSTSAFHKDPNAHLLDVSRLPDRALSSFLTKACNGRVYEDLGIAGCNDVYPLDWLTDDDRDLRSTLRELIELLACCWDGSALMLAGDDPFQTIHRQLFPSNLTHITGQFFSPEWLAELLIADLQWKPDETLIDPFCGSGVFLVKAVRSATQAGHCPTEVLKNIVGIDINPFAAAATRANLALLVARSDIPSRDRIHLNVLCADAIAPSVKRDIPLVDPRDPTGARALFRAAESHGFDLQSWRSDECLIGTEPPQSLSHRREVIEQSLTYCLQADVVATNPPWVGWEYLSRPYRDSIQSAWVEHDLYQSKGLEASFLKEDLSNLALLAAWSAYLRDSGRSAVVLRPSTMHSEVASRGVRRLSLSDGGVELKLEHIRLFDQMRLFKSASTPAATWLIRKGEKTVFPVPVTEFQKIRPRWNPSPTDRAAEVARQVNAVEKVAEPTDPENTMSRWMITTPQDLRSMRRLRGSNELTPRMGVFTGGANGVFYLRQTSNLPGLSARYNNITANSKRKVPDVEVELEQGLVHSIARGRDIGMWQCRPEVFLLLPHTAATRMYPIPESELASAYPKTHRYLSSMKEPLQARNGFATWEKKIHQQHFHTLQRIGSYTFAPYKVCWRYIATEFTICVLGSDPDGKTIVPNDKVMFIPMDDLDEAYFVAGFLSSAQVRKYIGSVIEKRQISTRVIKSIEIPNYDRNQKSHQMIRDSCREGHAKLQQQADADVSSLKARIDEIVENVLA